MFIYCGSMDQPQIKTFKFISNSRVATITCHTSISFLWLAPLHSGAYWLELSTVFIISNQLGAYISKW